MEIDFTFKCSLDVNESTVAGIDNTKGIVMLRKTNQHQNCISTCQYHNITSTSLFKHRKPQAEHQKYKSEFHSEVFYDKKKIDLTTAKKQEEKSMAPPALEKTLQLSNQI